MDQNFQVYLLLSVHRYLSARSLTTEQNAVIAES